MSNDTALSDELTAAGNRADDRAWPMPIGEEYVEQLKSNFADIANVGGREGGRVHRRFIPLEVRQGPALGAFGRGRHGMAQRFAKRQHRPSGRAAGRLLGPSRRCEMTERVDFYVLKSSTAKQRWTFACRLTEKAYLRDLRWCSSATRLPRSRRSTGCFGRSPNAPSCLTTFIAAGRRLRQRRPRRRRSS